MNRNRHIPGDYLGYERSFEAIDRLLEEISHRMTVDDYNAALHIAGALRASRKSPSQQFDRVIPARDNMTIRDYSNFDNPTLKAWSATDPLAAYIFYSTVSPLTPQVAQALAPAILNSAWPTSYLGSKPAT